DLKISPSADFAVLFSFVSGGKAMSFISTPTADIGKATAAMYASAETSYGYLPNMFRIFGHRPEVMERWGELLSSIRGQMNPRRYELVTLAAARELKSSYCMLAHGS